MNKKNLLFILLIACCTQLHAQVKKSNNSIDTSIVDYDELFSSLESFIDSLTAPKSFTIINVGAANGFFNYTSSDGSTLNSKKQLVLSPSIGYFDKSGFGINAAASVVNDDGNFVAYQLATTASYDYLQNRNFITGLSATHFFTKDSLRFYTSPLKNNINAYFSYRKWWIKPTVAVNYGWGSHTTIEEKQETIRLLKKGPQSVSTTTVETTEKVSDRSVTASLKHDFYWLNVISKKDFFRFTPQVTFTGGTQNFGFNQTNSSYISNKSIGTNFLYNTENVFVREKTSFQPIALTASVRTEFSKGIFFVQPQAFLDYLFKTTEKKFVTNFAINAGIIL